MAGWRCPEGDASSRWLIDIRTDLFPPTRLGSRRDRMRRQGRERSAGGARTADRADRSVRRCGRANQPAQPRSERGPISAASSLTADDEPCPPSPPPWMQRARHAAGRRRRRLPQEYDDEPRITRAPCIRCTATRRQHPQRRSRTISAGASPTPMPELRRARIRRAMTTRCMASSIPASSDYQHDPAYPDDPYAYQDGYDDEPKSPRRRSAAAA